MTVVCLSFAGCGGLGAACSNNSDCCLDTCQYGRCTTPPCFSGDTLVHIQGQSNPIPIRDLRTGQHVMCFNTTEDLRVPKNVSYCKVMNWVGICRWCCAKPV